MTNCGTYIPRSHAARDLETILKATVGVTGQRCLNRIVSAICTWTEADAAIIGEFISRDRMVTIAAYQDGEMLPNFECDLVGTPCRDVVKQALCVIPTGVAQKYPQGVALRDGGFDGFMGTPIRGDGGELIGILCALSFQPFSGLTDWPAIAQILSSRVAAEIGRMRALQELKNSEERLALALETVRESESRFRGLVESTSDWIWETNAIGAFSYISPKVEDVLGYKPEEMIGKTPFDFMTPEEAPLIFDEFCRKRDEGAPIERLENINVHKDGRHIVLETSGTPIFGPQGKLTGYRGIDRDITARKKSEEQRHRLQARVLQSQKLESLGALAGGIAHDFNNILAGMLSAAELAALEVSEASTIRPLLHDIQQGCMRGAGLTHQMLAYSGSGRFVLEEIDLSALVAGMASTLDGATSSSVSLRYELPGGLLPVLADAKLLQQVVLSLVTNAAEATDEPDGLVLISTRATERNDSVLHAILPGVERAEWGYVTLEVTDSGCGMSDDIQAKVFDPFFSTKFLGRGLGLAAVQGIVGGHKGAIRVRSSPGKGTTFEVFLPARQRAERRVNGSRPAQCDWRGSGTILLADDEAPLLRVTTRLLKLLGMSVITATDGAEAVDLFRKHNAQIVCVLLDVTMPGMDGVEAFTEIRKINTEVPVILSSGYEETTYAGRLGGDCPSAFLKKPYGRATLQETLQQLLDA